MQRQWAGGNQGSGWRGKKSRGGSKMENHTSFWLLLSLKTHYHTLHEKMWSLVNFSQSSISSWQTWLVPHPSGHAWAPGLICQALIVLFELWGKCVYVFTSIYVYILRISFPLEAKDSERPCGISKSQACSMCVIHGIYVSLWQVCRHFMCSTCTRQGQHCGQLGGCIVERGHGE